jgi:colanic acid biosynthesis glycosyl transferase WcaI
MKILLLNQAFYPDVVSTAQHAADLASQLATRGHEVTVLTSDRAYDNPAKKFPATEVWKTIKIQRVSATGFGKGAKWRRLADFGSFLFNCCQRLSRLEKFDVVIALTTPPLVGYLGALFSRFKGGKLVYWVMDLNPDQAIAAGWIPETSLIARLLKGMLHYSLEKAHRVIVLDRFMQARILAKGVSPDKVVITPPWSHDSAIQYSQDARDGFRFEHGLDGKFVVMYSGNHSPCHPLDTVMNAALQLRARQDIAFCFVGGGSEHSRIKRFANTNNLNNIVCLPYQPIEKLSGSLSAADLHLVVMGNEFVGIVHPCKIYNVLALGSRVLYVGPPETHVTDMCPATANGEWFYAAQHGDTNRVIQEILAAAGSERPKPSEQIAIAARFSQDVLVDRMIQTVESCDSAAISFAEQVKLQAAGDRRTASGSL